METASSHTSSLKERCSGSKLGRAAGSQSLENLQQALEGWTANEIDNFEGKNPLHMAAWQGCIENVHYLIEHVGCNVNGISTAEFSYGKTPLFFAATRCRNDVVMYLLDHGANVKIVNNKGQSVRSIAASHLSEQVLDRICQQEITQQEPWTNYRKTHSDGLEYGDLDPRFLDRPLRETDVVGEHAVNPTTKQSRQGSFLRKNPHLSTSSPSKTKSRPRRKKKQILLSEEEIKELEGSWTRVLETIEIVSEDDLVSLQKDIFTIVQLSDKQHGSWIPEAAQRFQNDCTNLQRVVNFLTSIQCFSDSKRERILVQKLADELLGVRGEGTESVTVSTDSSSSNSLSVSMAHELLRERRDELEVALATQNMAQFQKHGHDRLQLPEPPLWVDSVYQLKTLENALVLSNIAAIDTEWYDAPDGTIHVATLQLAIPGISRPWVLDLLSEELEFQTKSKSLVQTLFKAPRIVLGFAMGNDLPKIEQWLGSDLPQNTSCLDVQMLHCDGGQLKGLASIVQLYSDIPLSKAEQCSSWSDRPLSRAQLDYAGLDAAILPVLVAERLQQTI